MIASSFVDDAAADLLISAPILNLNYSNQFALLDGNSLNHYKLCRTLTLAFLFFLLLPSLYCCFYYFCFKWQPHQAGKHTALEKKGGKERDEHKWDEGKPKLTLSRFESSSGQSSMCQFWSLIMVATLSTASGRLFAHLSFCIVRAGFV